MPSERSTQLKRPIQGPLAIEIFLEIASFLQSNEVLALSLASSQIRALLLPELYRSVSLQTNRACLSGLAMLAQHSNLCKYIHTLTVRPNYAIVCWPRKEARMSECLVASRVKTVAHSLCNLKKFEWGGTGSPPKDFWLTLRQLCPKLQRVSSTAGCQPIDPGFELFQFNNLTGFSLQVCACIYDGDSMHSALPNRICTMLSRHCPNLEELTLRLLDPSRTLQETDLFTANVFPKLRSLHLDICLSSGNSRYPDLFPSVLGSFLSAHPALTELTILPYGRLPSELPLFLSPAALPNLSSFVGVYQHVAQLPHPQALTALDLTGDPVPADAIVTVASALRRLVRLQNLDVRLAHPGLFPVVVAACTELTELRVMFPVAVEPKILHGIAAALPRLPRLHSFTLYVGRRRGARSMPMLRVALQLLRAGPACLREVHLAWFVFDGACYRAQDGAYALRNSEDRRGARYLDVTERGLRRARAGGTFERRFRYALDGPCDLRACVVKGLARMRR
ncbi:hypothetical protein GGX14DRAFT_529538 [Mycena pura]|uniref:F-box domain-containing protein n=1 Tax=Mycena pura TaxID=153505 RepID=A0AAD6UQ67_9AGAR|nr:hypothetical protein GGX14DRAFT_529538 [Mycena pura]